MRKKFLYFTLFLIAVVLAGWVYLPVLTRYRDMKMQQEEISEKIASLDEKIRTLQEERELLKNDLTYIEKVIRDEMGLAKPGETIYKFVTETIQPKPEPEPEPEPDMIAAPPAIEHEPTL